MYRTFKTLCLLLSLSLLLGACSRMGLAYRNLDVIIPWTLSDYLQMDREQKGWFNDRLQSQLDWHCTTQLPGYLDWLDRLQLMVETREVNDANLQQRTQEARQAIADIARQITPPATELLQGLDNQQVAQLNRALAKDLRQRQVEYVQPPLAEQVDERATRMNKRLSTWLGPLTAGQRQRVSAWSTELGEQNREWIGNRARWQALFSAALAQRQQPDFPQRLNTLFVDRESLWTEEYRQAFLRTEQATRSLLVDLLAESSAGQRQRLVKKIAQTRQDFSELKCLQAARQP